MLITISVIGKGVFMSNFNNNQFNAATLSGMVDNLRFNGLIVIIGEI